MHKTERVFTGSFAIVDRVQTDRERASEVVRTKAGRFSVAFLLHTPELDQRIIFVKQVRSAMICNNLPTGEIIEVPAGRCDQPESAEETIAREASEEAGAIIRVDQVKLLNGGEPLAVSPGILDEMMYLAYVRLEPDQLEQAEREFGLEAEGERITRSYFHAPSVEMNTFQDLKTFALVQWFAANRELLKD